MVPRWNPAAQISQRATDQVSYAYFVKTNIDVLNEYCKLIVHVIFPIRTTIYNTLIKARE